MPTTRSQTAQDRAIIAESNEPGQTAVAGKDHHSSNGTRHRPAASAQYLTNDTDWVKARPRDTSPDEPLRFIINLSLPPEQRYLEVCTALKSEINNLTSLFDEVVGDMVNFVSNWWLHFLCRILLRGVYNKEENAELKGISKVTGVSIYLLVCFNVLLDLFMGCSSGGAAVSDGKGESKMVHFRTLDWGMPALRRIIVHLDFTTETGGPVVASSITYAGFVGVLTGVRKDFSVSLNFRPYHNDSNNFWANAKYTWHQILVLLGWRPSISSTLRDYLLPRRVRGSNTMPASMEKKRSRGAWSCIDYSDVIEPFRNLDKRSMLFRSTACYLCFSNGAETTVVEKDLVTAKVRSSDGFIVITNSDEDETILEAAEPAEDSNLAAALAEIVEEAKDRKQCAEHNWNNMKAARAKQSGLRRTSAEQRNALLTVEDAVTMVQKFPTTNEMTHFACVMDPSEGAVSWCRRWVRPVGAKWIRKHQSETW